MKLILLLSLFATSLFADGGKVLFQRKAGAFDITFFSTESPVRTGRSDLSVMVQNSATKTPVLDATVFIRLRRSDPGVISEISAPARHEQATNKLLYAANLNLENPGKYRAEISVDTKTENALLTGEIEVAPPDPPLIAHWPYFVAIPFVALIFLINQRLKRRRRASASNRP